MPATSGRQEQKKQKRRRKPTLAQMAQQADQALEVLVGAMQDVFGLAAEQQEKEKSEKDNAKTITELPKQHKFGQFVIPPGSRLSRWE